MAYTIKDLYEWIEENDDNIILDGPFELTETANDELCHLLNREFNLGMEEDPEKNNLDYVVVSVGEFNDESDEAQEKAFERCVDLFLGVINKFGITAK